MSKLIADNRRARRDYAVIEEYEAGIVLSGSEVKSLREGKCAMGDSHAIDRKGEIWLVNLHIAKYECASTFQHKELRPRKLLLNKREVNKLMGGVQRKGLTMVPLKIYFNKKGLVKCALALAQGRKEHDKRQVVKKRDWDREKGRILRKKN